MIFLLSDYNVTKRVQNETFGINELEVEMDPIKIFNDNFAEPNETIQITLSKGDGTEKLNFIPGDSLTMTILDDDGITVLMHNYNCASTVHVYRKILLKSITISLAYFLNSHCIVTVMEFISKETMPYT